MPKCPPRVLPSLASSMGSLSLKRAARLRDPRGGLLGAEETKPLDGDIEGSAKKYTTRRPHMRPDVLIRLLR